MMVNFRIRNKDVIRVKVLNMKWILCDEVLECLQLFCTLLLLSSLVCLSFYKFESRHLCSYSALAIVQFLTFSLCLE